MEGDDDKLIRTSAGLLSDLQLALPRLLWRRGHPGRVHQLVRLHDLEHVNQLIEPFQSEPQLLDSSLKTLLPSIIDAYLSFLQLPQPKFPLPGTLLLDDAASKLLYTFCKARGYKVIIGFLNNEPRYLELVLASLESCKARSLHSDVPWERSYILLLWLTHLMLVPFDLSSISAVSAPSGDLDDLTLPSQTPPIARRVVSLGIHYIATATREQDAAAKLLVRLATRPDMQRLHLPAAVVSWALRKVSSPSPSATTNLHESLGPLRFLVGMTTSIDTEEVAGLIPSIYSAGQRLMEDAMLAFLSSSAVTKKLAVKLFRNIALLSLQSTFVTLVDFFESTGVLEDTIDHCLQSLEDRDTPVRFAASKALSMVILRLDDELGYEVVQAVLDSFKEDMPSSSLESDFGAANPLKWHGLTLTLAHTLFRRSASPQQLPEILNALLLALNFEQRTAVGVSTGSNVRDAACFGIWSLSRRYTTQELLSVDISLVGLDFTEDVSSVIQIVAIQLLLAACLDPSGNIRRGSSAALQELIGRHPDQVNHGIALVQIVDYHAVGLRRRAMIDVAQDSSDLDPVYRRSLLVALGKWRGLGSLDVSSREAAAESTGRLCAPQSLIHTKATIASIYETIQTFPRSDVEKCHGSLMALSHIIDTKARQQTAGSHPDQNKEDLTYLLSSWSLLKYGNGLYTQHNPRATRAELPSAIARLISSLAELSLYLKSPETDQSLFDKHLGEIMPGLLASSEDSVLQILPRMVRALSSLQSAGKCKNPVLDISDCFVRTRNDSSGMILHGAGRAIAMGAASPWLDTIYGCDRTGVCYMFENTVRTAPLVEWRIVGLQALGLVIESGSLDKSVIDIVIRALDAGLNDYTITERGDVGSLVRTKSIQAVQCVWKLGLVTDDSANGQILQANIIRLSLEKLDKVRLQAARCLEKDYCSTRSSSDMDTSGYHYFYRLFQPLGDDSPAWKREAILKGSISCAGLSAESLLRASRLALVDILSQGSPDVRASCLSTFTGLLKDSITQGLESQPLLELIAYLLDALPQIVPSDSIFNWRLLLSQVQKSHYKSNNILRILAAVNIYRLLAEKPSVRSDALKKLISMLRTNPYPKVRTTVAECLFLLTGDQELKGTDWSKPGQKYDLPIQ